MSSLCSLTVRRGLGLFVGCVSIMLAGVTLTVATFTPNLKTQFQLEQMSVEAIASLGTIGASLGYPVGLAYEYLGSVRAYLVSLVVGTVSGLLLFMTQYSVEFYSQYWGFLALYWSVFGFSSVILFLVGVTVNMDNFSSRHRGLIAGTTGAAWWLGSASISAVFNSYFSNRPVGDFFLMLTILNVIISSLSAWLVRPLPKVPEKSNEWQALSPSQSEEQTKEEEPLSLAEQIGLDLLYLPDFHILTGAFLLAASIQLAYIANVTTFSSSYGLTEYNYVLTVASPVCACIYKFLTGWFSDLTKKCFPRIMYLLVMTFIQLLMSVISIFIGNNSSVLIATIIIVYMTNGCFYAVVPAVISDYFGMRHLSRNWGFEFFINSLLLLVTLAIFGAFYHDAIMISGSNDCFGLKCFRNFYILASVMTATSFCLFCWLYCRENKKLTPQTD